MNTEATITLLERIDDLKEKLLAEQGKMASLEAAMRQFEDCTVKSHNRIVELLPLLRKYEWLPDRYDADYCGTCHEDRSDGHTPGCALGDALKESG